MATKNNISVPRGYKTFEDLLTEEYGVPESVGRKKFEIDYIKFLKQEFKTSKDPIVKEKYKQRIAYYSKKHGLKV